MKKYLIGAIIGIILVAGLVWYFNRPNESLAGVANNPRDLVGTHVGTTTTGIPFKNNTASTTYPLLIGNEIDTVDIKMTAVYASTSAQGPNVFFSFLESDDPGCNTLATSTTDQRYVATSPLTRDIRWFDASFHTKGVANTVNLPTATTTYKWIPVAGFGVTTTFVDMNARCVALEVSASGTVIQVEVGTKSLTH